MLFLCSILFLSGITFIVIGLKYDYFLKKYFLLKSRYKPFKKNKYDVDFGGGWYGSFKSVYCLEHFCIYLQGDLKKLFAPYELMEIHNDKLKLYTKVYEFIQNYEFETRISIKN